jgi:hypothetical protein
LLRCWVIVAESAILPIVLAFSIHGKVLSIGWYRSW